MIGGDENGKMRELEMPGKEQIVERIVVQSVFSARSPTLSTVRMVERTIEENSGEFNCGELWKSLPKQVMWSTFLKIVDYLKEINKIGIEDGGKIVYIWNPELLERILKNGK